MKIGIINYNFCNPHSIYQTMKSLTDNVEIVNDANNLKKFDKIIISTGDKKLIHIIIPKF